MNYTLECCGNVFFFEELTLLSVSDKGIILFGKDKEEIFRSSSTRFKISKI